MDSGECLVVPVKCSQSLGSSLLTRGMPCLRKDAFGFIVDYNYFTKIGLKPKLWLWGFKE